MGNYSDGQHSGLRGETFSGSSAAEYAGYMTGKAQRAMGQPTMSTDGAGCTVLILSPFVCFIYPIAGAFAIGTWLFFVNAIVWLGIARQGAGVDFFVPLLLGFLALIPGFGIERRMANLKGYRVLRDLMRIGVASILPIRMLLTTGRNVPSGGKIFLAILMVPAAYWLLKRIDTAIGAGGLPKMADESAVSPS